MNFQVSFKKVVQSQQNFAQTYADVFVTFRNSGHITMSALPSKTEHSISYVCVSIYLRLGIRIDFFFIKNCMKLVKSRIMYISAKFSNWHFKCNILGKMIVLGNGCINL